jgi:hypothetical protein
MDEREALCLALTSRYTIDNIINKINKD